jgi:hypothetical protein
MAVNVSYYIPNVGWTPLPGSPYNVDLCSSYPHCPLNAGPIALKFSFQIPLLTPAVGRRPVCTARRVVTACQGKYEGSISLTDQTSELAFCVDFQTQMVI